MRLLRCVFFALFLVAFALSPCVAGDDASEIKLDVKEFKLGNGMHFLVVERRTTPQIACRVAIRAGSALEESGKTGIAHLLEHMMFKGTKNFGVLNPERDQELQEQIEAAYQVVLAEQRKRSPDKALIEAKLAEMDRLRQEVQKIYVPQAFSSQLGRNGAVGINAFTSKDQTQYLADIPSDMIEQWFSIASEQLFEPSWREFYVEREVVQREWAFRYVNDPDGAGWLDLHATAYTAHPYRNPTIGWKSDIEKFSTTDAIAFHKKYYNPSNAVCVLVGDITAEKAKALAELYFERYPAGQPAPEQVTKEPPQQGPRKNIRYLKGARAPLLLTGFHAAAMGTKDFYALDALTMVLSYGRGARLTQEIVNKGLAVEAWAHNPDNRYGGMMILGASPKEPDELKKKDLTEEEKRQAYLKACENLEGLLILQVEKLKTEPVTGRELQRIKKLSHRDFLDRIRSNKALAGAMASTEVDIGWRYILTYLDRIAEVTPEDIRLAANKYIQPQNKTTIYVIPGGEPEQSAEPYQEIRTLSGSEAAKVHRPHDFTNHSIYPTPQGWKHPLSFDRTPSKIGYEKAEMATAEGVTVFYLPNRELPLIDLTVLVKAGSVDEEDSKLGLTKIFNDSLILGGTERLSPFELAMVLDENAIDLSVSVNEEDATIKLSVMKEDWQKGLALLEEILTRPRFDPAIVEVAKEQAVIALKRQGGDARAVSMREAKIRHFKGHPYGRDPLLGIATIPNITLDDLKGFLKAYFVPSNMVASVAGDIEKESVLTSLGNLFRALPKNQTPERRLEEPAATPPALVLIHKPGQVQSQVTLALRGIERTHPDYWKMHLLMNIFGGSDSLLFTRLRDDLGLVYGAWFYQTYKWKAGLLLGYIGSKGEQTGAAIQETVNIMNGLRRNVQEGDLEQKRLDALNSFVFNVDTPLELVEAYGRYHMRNESLDTLEKIQEAFLSAKREELVGLAEKYLDPTRLQIFVVGDLSTIVKGPGGALISLGEALKALGEHLGLPSFEVPLR
ncbi:MAG: insulinase family protein [Proteobacteria bacterium]|nr:insulinase family protein [Pseudomonadota bacterium]